MIAIMPTVIPPATRTVLSGSKGIGCGNELMVVLSIGRPNPTSKLKAGLAKHAAKAICALPFFARATLATKSPMEFPQAITVAPKNCPGMAAIVPNDARQNISSSAAIESHRIQHQKPTTDRNHWNVGKCLYDIFLTRRLAVSIVCSNKPASSGIESGPTASKGASSGTRSPIKESATIGLKIRFNVPKILFHSVLFGDGMVILLSIVMGKKIMVRAFTVIDFSVNSLRHFCK
mmetsp:Transcript_3555/g.22339  ORF Transcript_3555/g.22339 Transcript_3555/m.22339 type:complete len:233 (-) Transcript_3555:1272-1970(-)